MNKTPLTLLVANFEGGTSDQELSLHFGSRCGESPLVQLRRDPKTGRSFGYAIIHFQTRDAFDKAAALDTTQFRGQPLKVKASSVAKLYVESKDHKMDSIAEFEMYLNRRFFPRDIRRELKRCPECFLPVIAEDMVPGCTVYNCPKCHKTTRLFRDYDHRQILTQCLICFDLFEVDKMLTCRSEHLFCVKCIDRWLKHCTTHGTSGKTYLPCPNCEGSFLYSDLTKKANRHQLSLFEANLPAMNDQYEKALASDNVLANDDSTLFRRCPRCRYSWVARRQILPHDEKARCPQARCSLEFCYKCLSPWSDPNNPKCKACRIAAQVKKDQYWQKRKDEITNRNCPKCSLPVFRNDGCNHVICTRCGTGVCFICREANIDPIEHFCRCFRTLKRPNEHLCSRRCSIFQDSECYDAELLRLLEQERRRTESVEASEGSSDDEEKARAADDIKLEYEPDD